VTSLKRRFQLFLNRDSHRQRPGAEDIKPDHPSGTGSDQDIPSCWGLNHGQNGERQPDMDDHAAHERFDLILIHRISAGAARLIPPYIMSGVSDPSVDRFAPGERPIRSDHARRSVL
jgi:hypothetical protein